LGSVGLWVNVAGGVMRGRGSLFKRGQKSRKSINLSWNFEDFRWEWPSIGVEGFKRAFQERKAEFRLKIS
jgi:hypothetical protein